MLMYEYINRLCKCGMRIDDAYAVCNDFFRELDFEGLKEYVKQKEIIAEVVNTCVD